MTMPAGVAWLFCPADRPERFATANAAADVVVLDLEDGVAPAHKASARDALRAVAATLDSRRTVIRVNPVGTHDHALDLDLLSGLPDMCVMLAKAESAADLDATPAAAVVALCETARGALNAFSIATAPNCVGLMWGAEDLIADLGGSSSRTRAGAYRDVAVHARNHVLLASAAAEVPALDAVYLDIADLDGLRDEAVAAAASGFAGKVCIHPTQTDVVRSSFAPSAEQVDWARRVLGAVDAPGAHGVVQVEGRMVDEPILRQARKILADRSIGGSP